MAKNTNSNAFRKIDVDQFNEDNFKDEDGPSTPHDSSVGGIEAEVSNLLSNAQHSEALKMCLANAPIGNKNQEEKVNMNTSLNIVGRGMYQMRHNLWRNLLVRAKLIPSFIVPASPGSSMTFATK